MVAVPANLNLTLEFQDNRGFRSTSVVKGFESDVSTDGLTVGVVYGVFQSIAATIAAMSNAKLVRVGWGYDFDYAQEPASETGQYQLVIQKARLQGGDGNGGFMSLAVPAPKDSLFLTTASENLVTVDPNAGLVTAFLAAASGGGLKTPRGGNSFSQFFGGQLVQGKPRVRRVLQGT